MREHQARRRRGFGCSVLHAPDTGISTGTSTGTATGTSTGTATGAGTGAGTVGSKFVQPQLVVERRRKYRWVRNLVSPNFVGTPARQLHRKRHLQFLKLDGSRQLTAFCHRDYTSGTCHFQNTTRDGKARWNLISQLWRNGDRDTGELHHPTITTDVAWRVVAGELSRCQAKGTSREE